MRLFMYLWSKLIYRIKIEKLRRSGVFIRGKSQVTYLDRIRFGENIYIGPDSLIMAKGGLILGNNIRIGPRVAVWTENHNYRSQKMIPYDNDDISRMVEIGDNVWIGLGAIISPGTKIGEGVIISMGAVVRGEIPPCSIVAGNPAKIVGKREIDIYYRLKEQGAFHKL